MFLRLGVGVGFISIELARKAFSQCVGNPPREMLMVSSMLGHKTKPHMSSLCLLLLFKQ